MKFLKRKAPNNDYQFEDENEISVGDISEADIDKIENSDVADGDYSSLDAVPSANESGREGGNTKRFKLAVIALVGLLLLMMGVGVSASRYQKAKEERRVEEAEKTAQDQKRMATGSGINIARDQEDLANSGYDFPLPDGAELDPTDPNLATMNAMNAIANDPYASPTVPQYEPAPSYNQYDSTVSGRDFTPPPAPPAPEPVQSAPSFMSNDSGNNGGGDMFTASAPVQQMTPPPPLPKGADSDVLVDVNAIKTLTATNNSGNQRNKLGDSLKPTVLESTSASRRGDTSLLLMKGTTIPCVLKTKIDSTYQGFTVCQISRDVYSTNGKTLLLERGSTVFGEQNVEIKQGQARVAILWSKVETPKGISVDLNSPAVGGQGQAGVGAKVNNHFWKRFGGAIMLSLIQDAINAGSSRLEKKGEGGDNNTTINSTASTTQSMAEKALDNTINIPPTAIINQGAILNIMVVRDVDFSSVYKIRKGR